MDTDPTKKFDLRELSKKALIGSMVGMGALSVSACNNIEAIPAENPTATATQPGNEYTSTETLEPSLSPSPSVEATTPGSIPKDPGVETTEPISPEIAMLREWTINYERFADWGSMDPQEKADAVDDFIIANGGETIYTTDANSDNVVENMFKISESMIRNLYWDSVNPDTTIKDSKLPDKLMDVIFADAPEGEESYKVAFKRGLDNEQSTYYGYDSEPCVGDRGKLCDVMKQGVGFDTIAASSGVTPLLNRIDGSEFIGINATVICTDPTGATKDIDSPLYTVDGLVINLSIVEDPLTGTWKIRERDASSSEWSVDYGYGRVDVSTLEAVKVFRQDRLSNSN